MKTVHRLKRLERREQIIKTAIKLFAQKGFNGTKTSDIAKTAGVSEALIFKFFPDKSSLYSAIIKYRIKQVEVFYKEKIEPADDVRILLIKIAKMHIENVEKDDTFMRMLLFSALEGHKLSQEFYNVKISRIIIDIANFIEKKIEEGEFRNLDPILSARIFMGMIYNYLLLKKIFKIKKPPLLNKDITAETIVSVFLDGIKKKPEDRGKQ